MRKAYTIVVIILVFLAISSGVTKIILMQQDVDFFGKYGFSDLGLIALGAAQLLGGLALIPDKTRFFGALLVAITFAISLVLLIVEGAVPVAVVTTLAILGLGLVMKQSRTTT